MAIETFLFHLSAFSYTCNIIRATPRPIHSVLNDNPCWNYSPNGQFTSRSAYLISLSLPLPVPHPAGTSSGNPTLSLESKHFFGQHAMIAFPQRTNSSSTTFYLKTLALSAFHLLKPPSTSFGIVHTLQQFGKIPQTPPFLTTSSPSNFPTSSSSSHPPHLKLQTTIPYLSTSSPP